MSCIFNHMPWLGRETWANEGNTYIIFLLQNVCCRHLLELPVRQFLQVPTTYDSMVKRGKLYCPTNNSALSGAMEACGLRKVKMVWAGIQFALYLRYNMMFATQHMCISDLKVTSWINLSGEVTLMLYSNFQIYSITGSRDEDIFYINRPKPSVKIVVLPTLVGAKSDVTGSVCRSHLKMLKDDKWQRSLAKSHKFP